MERSKIEEEGCLMELELDQKGIEEYDRSVYIPNDILHEIIVWYISMSHPAFFKNGLKLLVSTCKIFKMIVDRIMKNEKKYLPMIYHSQKEEFKMDKDHCYLVNEADHEGPFTARFVIKKLFKEKQSSVDILTSRHCALRIRQFAMKPFIGYTRFGGFDKSFAKASVDLISDNDWDVVTFSFEGEDTNIMKIFIGNKLVDQAILKRGRNVLPLSQMGGRSHELRYSFMGPILEMTIWKECLSEEYIKKNAFELPTKYFSKKERSCEKVVGNWFFPELKERIHGDIIIEKIEYKIK